MLIKELKVLDLAQIEDVLKEKFNKGLTTGQQRHIIFWYDEEEEFVDEIDELELDDVKVWKLTGNNNFATKYQLEVVDQESNYLVYSSQPQPDKRENWLLDIISYSQSFSANRITLIMQDFGLGDNKSLRPVFKKYKRFFDNKKRYAKLKSYNLEEYTEERLDIAFLSVLCNLKAPNLENAVKKILMDSLHNDENKYLSEIRKFCDEATFWNLVADNYGYSAEEKSLQDLMLSLVITNLEHNLTLELPTAWQTYLLDRESNSIIFVDHWMNHTTDAERYDEIVTQLGEELKLKDYIADWELKDYLQCDTFKIFDVTIINRIINNLLNDLDDFDRYQEIISIRRTKHWYQEFSNAYEAIYWAIEIFKTQKIYNKRIKQEQANDLFNRYIKEYHLTDKAYRKFYAAYDNLENKDLILDLQERIENLYTNWYLPELSKKWSNSIEQELTDSWMLSDLNQQQDFYQDFIKQIVDNKGDRVFVIISDALRYEAAAEFSARLNAEVKGATQLYAMQGSLPSYTKLGMASLLPNQEIKFADNGDIVVDGISSKGSKNREKILSSYEEESVILNYEQVSQMKRSELRDACKGKKLVYIYHNAIDAKGDHATTENEVFTAVEQTFEELDSLVKTLKHGLSAAHIYITADHGFIYQRSPLEVSDKTDKVKDDIIETKRRVMISNREVDLIGTLSIDLDYIYGEDSNLRAIVPRGVNRFVLQGPGQNFVHGGASLQEIAIPVIKFKNDRSKDSKNEAKKVDLKLTNISRKITNNVFHLEFFQTEKIQDKVVPRRLKLYFEDEAGDKISNENIIIADRESDNPEERSFKEKFTLKGLEYRRDEDYYLILVSEETGEVYEKIRYKINLL